MDVPLKNYSSGMHMRLGFAIAANLDPDVLLLDEIFAVGDDDFQKQCMGTLKSFQAQGKTILFVSHSSAAVQAICHRACLLDRGHLIMTARWTRRSANTAVSPPRPPASRCAASRAPPTGRRLTGDPELAWHRLAAGGHWADEGHWVFDFLRRQGLSRGLTARRRLRQPVRGHHAAALHGAQPLLGLRERPRALHRGLADRAAAGRRPRGARPLHGQRRLRLLRGAAPVRPGDRRAPCSGA